jgi:ankyrin repeat protein
VCNLRSGPLHDAAVVKNLLSVRSLLNNGADINARDGQSRIVLRRAAMVNGNVEVLQTIYTENAILRKVTGSGMIV